MNNQYNKIFLCPNCYKNHDKSFFFLVHGYVLDPRRTNKKNCICCNTPFEELIPTNITDEEYSIIGRISQDPSFFEAMMQLKEDNIIEYQSRMAQFRTQVEGQEDDKEDVLKCPKCGSTNISTGARGVNFFWGFLGADKTVNRCGNCGHTWKPKL